MPRHRYFTLITPTLVVDAAGTGFDVPTSPNTLGTTATEFEWYHITASGKVVSPRVKGKLIKIFIEEVGTNSDGSADLQVTGLTTGETYVNLSAEDFTDDIGPLYIKVLNVTNANAALTATGNIYSNYVVDEQLQFDVTSHTAADSFKVHLVFESFD